MGRTFPTEDLVPRPLSTPLATEILAFIEGKLDLRPKTKMEYRASLERFDGWLGHGTLGDLTPQRVNAYICEKLDAGKPYIARNDMATIKVFGKWLVANRRLKDNPVANLVVPEVSQKGRPPFVERELVKILEAASSSRYPSTSSRDRLIVMLALWTGLRLNELRNLRWPDDIDLEEGVLYVRASKTDAGIRQVPLDDRIRAEIASHVRNFRAWGEQPGPLFLNANGKPFTYHAFARVQGRIRERLAGTGIDYKIHRLRNTWARTMRSLNVDVLDIQQMGGWTDLAMVKRYAGNKPINELRRLPSVSNAFGKIA